jgi:superoxide reductase
MMEKRQIYKCPVCGNIVEVLHAGSGQVVCCGHEMELQVPNTVDAALEKHVPVIEKTEFGYRIKVGSVPHPMTPEHHIEWIELVAGGAVYRKELEITDKPEAVFLIAAEGEIEAREYCNLHGLWSAKFEE